MLRVGDLGLLFLSSGVCSSVNVAASPPPPPPPPPPTGDITVSLVASRVSGPAPLAVHFSAIDTTSTISGVSDTFRQLLYSFDYGDTGAGTWTISGLSKNSDIGGPVGAHVFETPGTYVVRCTATRDSSTNYNEVTITVTDPDTVYSGTNTVFVSTSGNYTGAPAGAQTVTSIPTITSNKRYMLRRGESFGSITIPHGVSGVQVTDAGSGAKPSVSSITVGTGGLPPNTNFPNDITFENLQMSGIFTHNSAGDRMLLLNVDQPSSNQYEWGAAADYWADPTRFGTSMPRFKEVFMVGCTGHGSTSYAGTTCALTQGAILGCDLKQAQQHCMRLWFGVEAFVAHNDIRGPSDDGIRHSLKMHGAGIAYLTPGDTYADCPLPATRHSVIANNIFFDTDDNNQFPLALDPQNDTANEGLRDCIVENNRFRTSGSLITPVSASGIRMTAINNTMLVGGSAASTSMPGLHHAGLPSGWDGPYYTSRT